jgi:hypothetical protein
LHAHFYRRISSAAESVGKVIFHKFAVSKINYLRIAAVKDFEVLPTACDEEKRHYS